jgi:sugar lactone lactonase YvrE
VYTAEAVAGSPTLAAGGMAWWKERLIIADRGGKRLVAFTPPSTFETLREGLVPVGLATAPDGNLVLVERDPNRVVCMKADGTSAVIAEENVGTPKLPHADGRAVWRFPIAEDGTIGTGAAFFKTPDLKPHLENLPPAKDGKETLVGWVGRLQGLAVDAIGNVYIAGAESHTSGEAVAVISPDGTKVVAMILGVPRNVSGLAFGGPDGRTLYVTGAGEYRLHKVLLPTPGAGW